MCDDPNYAVELTHTFALMLDMVRLLTANASHPHPPPADTHKIQGKKVRSRLELKKLCPAQWCPLFLLT